jgi:uncharacterized membrane protein (DUF4010 family)
MAESLFIQILKPVTNYALVPLWFALLAFIITEILVIKKGISLREGVKGKTFGLVIATAILWLARHFVPVEWYMPLEIITVKLMLGILATILTMKLAVFYFSEIAGSENSLKELGIGAGISESKIAVEDAIKLCKEDEGAVNDGVAVTMLENTTELLRNFVMLTVVIIALGALPYPPAYFTIPMLSMTLICLGVYIGFNWKSTHADAPEYSFFFPKKTMISMIAFIALYYLAFFAFDKLGYAGLYILLIICSIIYGSTTLFVILAMMLSGNLTVMSSMYAIVIMSAGSIMSNTLYSYIGGSKKLGFYLLITSAATILIGIGTMLVFA